MMTSGRRADLQVQEDNISDFRPISDIMKSDINKLTFHKVCYDLESFLIGFAETGIWFLFPEMTQKLQFNSIYFVWAIITKYKFASEGFKVCTHRHP